MKGSAFLLGAVAAVAGLVAFMAPASGRNDDEVAPIFGIKIPSGCRDWRLENNKVFGRPQSFVAGPPKNGVQFMVKDSKKYAATGGWGFAQFNDRKPADEAVHKTCFPCHTPAKDRDYVFTHYAP